MAQLGDAVTGLLAAWSNGEQAVALKELARIDPRQSRLVELRFFGGLSVNETAVVLGVAPITVKRDWAFARAWLFRALQEKAP